MIALDSLDVPVNVVVGAAQASAAAVIVISALQAVRMLLEVALV